VDHNPKGSFMVLLVGVTSDLPDIARLARTEGRTELTPTPPRAAPIGITSRNVMNAGM